MTVPSTSSAPSVAARLYLASGAAVAQPARLTASPTTGALLLTLDGLIEARRVAVGALSVSERFSHATRRVTLPGGDILEVDDGAQLGRVLAAAGLRDARVTRWQHSGSMVLISVALSVFAAVAAYRWGVPLAADRLARIVPATWMQSLDDVVIGQLQRQGSLTSSALPEARQEALRAAFKTAVATRPEAPAVNVYFFQMGHAPNAFALPGGSIVFLDGLVKIAPNDDALMGVFAHEFGHVLHRHGMRNLLRTAMASAIAAWYFGDFTMLANAALLITQLKYSREFETQADDTALEVMRTENLDTKSLAELFRRMRDHRSVDTHDQSSAVKEPKQKTRSLSMPEFLSTHPDIERRIERFERATHTAPKP
jgi:Zn-dependent protease with chaperone function